MAEVWKVKDSKKCQFDINDYPIFLTVNEVAEILQIGVRTAYKVMDQDDFPLFRIGKSKRVRRDDFLDWIKKQGR